MNGNKVYLEAPEIISEVARFYKLKIENIISPCRKHEWIKAKYIAMFCCKQFMKPSKINFNGIIGSYFSGKDRTTVHHAIKSVIIQASIYRDYREDLNIILDKFNIKCLDLENDDDDEFWKKHKHFNIEMI